MSTHTSPAPQPSPAADAVVIGSGYAGVLLANHLSLSGLRVVMVSADGRFCDRIRLHEVVAGVRPHADVDVRSRLHDRVELLTGRAERVREGAVVLEDGREIAAEHIVLATGSGGAAIRPATVRVDTAPSAADAARAIAQLAPGGSVSVVGAGLTGIEVATEIAERRPDLAVTLHGRHAPGHDLGAVAAAHVRDGLARLGVLVRTETVDLGDASAVADLADVVVDATGMRGDDLAARSGLAVDELGRLLVDACLRVQGASGLWAAGDAARIADGPDLRRGCAVAEPMAGHVAEQILRVRDGRAPRPFRYAFMVRCMSLGRRDGVIQPLHADDTPRRRALVGRAGAGVKELVCRGAAMAPGSAPRPTALLYRALGTLPASSLQEEHRP